MATLRLTSSVLPSLCFIRHANSSFSSRKFAWKGYPLRQISSCKTTRLQLVVPMSSSHVTDAPPDHEGDVEQEFTLLKQKCVPCSSKELRPMTEGAARTLLSQIPDWELLDTDGKLQLQRRWKAKNFVKGLEFFKCIADIAESEGHHPDLHLVGWNNVIVNIFTHSIGGLTENDFILAAKISTLDCKELMRKSIPKAPPAES
ncbi:hypothetical protein R1sor_022132 [Riccia sorocarpa]|uniref:4a-hydroxytetrahydrobiopterin dehydratase n=1 Tax=Riccia sorocarpa TaxID=122646 RepID=A0ABD3GKH8_9MARC